MSDLKPEPEIKIVSFQRHSSNEDQQRRPAGREEISLNIIVYTTQKKLTFAENYIKDKERDDLKLVRCNKVSNLNTTINSIKVGVPTICIADQFIDKEVLDIFFANQVVKEDIGNFRFCLFVDDVETVDHRSYHLEGLELITSSQEKLLSYLEETIKKRTHGLTSQISSSTINSEDKFVLQAKFERHNPKDKLANLPNEDISIDSQKFIDNGVPGVGQYTAKQMDRGQNAVFTREKKKFYLDK